ncbi:hypothetical protein NHX12_026300 [Muraenolepis orangiensis]|uniref:Uncharacterized protein n=1 Tax=Muraenolepis orangiensis TaxID=630683 RepID=A0A9Q0EJA9_9TELE|nr:hypothetical protein NHX12_026300 [Muraenolepis orangiensis]
MTSTWDPEALKEAYERAEVVMLQRTQQEDKGIMKKRMAKYYKLWQDQGVVSKQHPPTREQLRVLARNLMQEAAKVWELPEKERTRTARLEAEKYRKRNLYAQELAYYWEISLGGPIEEGLVGALPPPGSTTGSTLHHHPRLPLVVPQSTTLHHRPWLPLVLPPNKNIPLTLTVATWPPPLTEARSNPQGPMASTSHRGTQ